MAKKTEAKPEKKKSGKKTKKASKVEKDKTYECEICGCEMICTSPSEGEVICCGEPMSLVG